MTEESTELWARRYLDEMHDVILVVNMDTAIVMEANERGCREMGWSIDDVVGKPLSTHLHPEDHANVGEVVETIKDDHTHRYVQRWRHSEEGWKVFDVYSRLIDETRLLVCGRDMTALHESQARNEHLNRLVELTDDLLVVSNMAGEVLYANQAASKLHGQTDFSGTNLSDFIYDEEGLRALSSLASAITDPNHRASTRLRARRADNSMVELWTSTVFDPTTALWYTVERDMTESDDAERELLRLNAELTDLATTDALTGLLNRAVFERSLQHAIGKGVPFALLLLDMDNFKLINDTMGHGSGDELLRLTAARLTNGLLPDDVLARFGGDEFVLLLNDVSDETEAARRATDLSARLSDPFSIDGRIVHSACSIGIALSDSASTPSDLIRNADIATYKAKELGRSRFEIFDAPLRDEVDRRFELETDLRSALFDNQIDVAFQGIFCNESLDHLGFEALVRWHHPVKGAVPPDQFINIAEDCHLLDDLTVIVLSKSMEVVRDWLTGDRFLTINVAPSQLQTVALLERLQAVLRVFDVAPHHVVIEITEVGLTGVLDSAQPTLLALRAAGFRLAIDDFGKGASSLGYLRDLPITMVKIDGSFVHHLAEDEFAATITSSVIDLARRLGLATVAECVETPAQLELLRGMGCEMVQGYLLHHPTQSAPDNDLFSSLPTAAASAQRA